MSPSQVLQCLFLQVDPANSASFVLKEKGRVTTGGLVVIVILVCVAEAGALRGPVGLRGGNIGLRFFAFNTKSNFHLIKKSK